MKGAIFDVAQQSGRVSYSQFTLMMQRNFRVKTPPFPVLIDSDIYCFHLNDLKDFVLSFEKKKNSRIKGYVFLKKKKCILFYFWLTANFELSFATPQKHVAKLGNDMVQHVFAYFLYVLWSSLRLWNENHMEFSSFHIFKQLARVRQTNDAHWMFKCT